MLAFYADESGSFDLHNPSQPWAVFLAIGFDDDHWLAIDRALRGLKAIYFPRREPQEIEIRSNDLRMANVHPRDGNPFSALGPSELRSFGNELYALIDKLPFEWCASVIHKPTAAALLRLHDAHDVFACAYARLLDRLDAWCAEAETPGRLFVDQRESNIHGKTHRALAEQHHRRDVGSAASAMPRVIERPYFHDSARSNHIQIADIMAYNVLRRFRQGTETYPYFERIAPKMHRFAFAQLHGLHICAPGSSENDESG